MLAPPTGRSCGAPSSAGAFTAFSYATATTFPAPCSWRRSSTRIPSRAAHATRRSTCTTSTASFPGSELGKNWFSDVLAKVIADKILAKADILFDYHGGGSDTIIHYHYTADPNRSARHSTIHDVARASGAAVLWEQDESRGTLSNCGDALGKLCFVPEIGGGGLILDEGYFEKAYQDLLNMLRVVEVVKGKPDLSPGPHRRQEGLARSARSMAARSSRCAALEILGTSVRRGTVLGRVVSPYSFEVLDEIVAPFDKTEIMQVRNRISKVHPGEYAYIIGDGDSGYTRYEDRRRRRFVHGRARLALKPHKRRVRWVDVETRIRRRCCLRCRCSPAEAQAEVTVVVPQLDEPRTLSPNFAADTGGYAPTSNIYSHLVTMDWGVVKGTPAYGDLAESWETSRGRQDGDVQARSRTPNGMTASR